MRFLFICTGNVVRSPAAEAVLHELAPGLHETRSAGISPFCPRPVTGGDLEWADVIAVMEADHRIFIAERWPTAADKVRLLHVEDRYHRQDPALHVLLEARLSELLGKLKMV
ncbi:MAG TPA: phosphotyrosine protein phosphatase [Methylomirabilota bacterium]|nr:phosphotyrosine protein phosphatase [Methylomirabilota bacterium]